MGGRLLESNIRSFIRARRRSEAEAATIVWNAMRRSALAGEIGFRLEPLLLDGPPGIGKSSWARALARLLGVEGMVLDATGEQASFGITGLQKGWSGSIIGRPLDLIMRTQGANPIFVIDEIDKAATARSSKDASFGLAEALLPFLEKSSAASWNCPALRLPFDMSWIDWVLTSNDMNVLPDPLTR
ncbi:AAA family ATPase [Pseudotabrizicola alkalilacus]|uniref:AAA family ATPase n=2 Tax=Pseudotabrizicola alkalilacus TaxID=2305252 RepID=A0A411Z0H4_9RHOB|nr:AAA family ATPase [Pseudotabrizicola alkalilacus]